MTEVRVRFAPSPTGALHIGGVRTALYNYLFAKQHGGKCIFRLEDTDSSRFVPGAEEYIMESFDWLGIHFDESVRDGGPYSPYKQSERKAIYQKYVHQLLEAKRAYIAFDTPEELTAKREEIKNFQYDASTRELMRNSLTLSQEEVEQAIAAGEKYVVRIKIEPGHDIVVNDLIRGKVTINSSVLDDKVLFKTSDMLPTYHMANVVDDHLMKISHVIRGEEWLPSAPLHVLLYRYLGWEDTMPRFAHLPLLLKPDGNGKLSKRDGDRLGFPVFPLQWTDPKTGAVSAGYREAGYFPEAVINFLALLGWNDGTEKELFSMEELIASFNLEKCSKSGAKFDYEKGTWFNHKYLQLKSNEELGKVLETEAKAHGCSMEFSKIMAIAGLMKERCSFTNDLWPQCDFFFIDPTEFPEKDIKKRWKTGTHQIIVEAKELLENMDATLSPEQMEDIMKDFCETHEYGMGKVMNPLRLSLIGAMKGPQIFDFIQVIGMQKALQRIEFALKTLPQI